MRSRLILAVCILALPLLAHGAVVEEPDIDIPEEDGMEQPKNEIRPPVPEEPEVKKSPSKPAPVQNPAEKGQTGFNTVLLRGLNKVTAHAETIDAPIGSVVRFGTLEIVAHRCWKSAPEDRPENAALIEIAEIHQNEPPQRIFMGWMFSSSPALSSLEHPFYDVTVIACEQKTIKD